MKRSEFKHVRLPWTDSCRRLVHVRLMSLRGESSQERHANLGANSANGTLQDKLCDLSTANQVYARVASTPAMQAGGRRPSSRLDLSFVVVSCRVVVCVPCCTRCKYVYVCMHRVIHFAPSILPAKRVKRREEKRGKPTKDADISTRSNWSLFKKGEETA
ncbi:hypothetical protein M440DRAFT_1036150 [Trichoderma longibrachiatum ATCC 18648]|uniref:Uncharacterized protein n=1 Tax=Trichoderma longibrachiatum ATCC 18648 TaxID=983965 RepID=A0A2T4C043_TRILO|nr:hypothetical protein M440DRAFT_1036150 [Trichoderma longibrachiatum ATCC 18648]